MANSAEVVSGGNKFKKRGNNGNGTNRQPGITPIDFWEKSFETQPWFNDIEKILEMPGTDDMAGVLSRGNFRNERQRVAAVRLVNRHRKFHDDNHQKMLRDYVASGLGMQALGKILQIQMGTNLMVPGVLREILGMKQRKEREEVARGSDFREKDQFQNGNNNNNGGNQ